MHLHVRTHSIPTRRSYDLIGFINVVSFSADTGADAQAAIRGIEKSLGHKPLGYILDLRSNPGGLLDEAVNVSDIFLEHGEIVSQRGRTKGDIERYYAKAGDDTGGLPVIVLDRKSTRLNSSH